MNILRTFLRIVVGTMAVVALLFAVLASQADSNIHDSTFVQWMWALLWGDWGQSTRTGEAVLDAVLFRVPVTLAVTVPSLLLMALMSVIATLCRQRCQATTQLIDFSLSLLRALPSYTTAVLLVTLFSVWLNWLPGIVFWPLSSEPAEWLRSLILPVMAVFLTHWGTVAQLAHVQYPAMVDDQQRRSAGAQLWMVCATVSSLLANRMPHIIGSVLIIEAIFAIPGLARLLLIGVYFRDLSFLAGAVLSLALIGLICRIGLTALQRFFHRRARRDSAHGTTEQSAQVVRVENMISLRRGLATELVSRLWLPLTWLCIVVAASVLATLGSSTLGSSIEPDVTDLTNPLAAPGLRHWLGTDALGRDLFARLVHGAVPLLLVAGASTVLAIGVVAVLKLLQANGPARLAALTSGLLMVVSDVLSAVPALVIAVLLIAASGAAVSSYVAAFTLALLPYWLRHDWTGRTGFWLRLMSAGCVSLATVLVWAAALGFVGLGVSVTTSGWGAAIAAGREHLSYAPAVSLVPALALSCCLYALLSIAATLDSLMARSRGS